MALNRFMGIGNLGSDPVVKTMESGVKVANFNIAITERGYKTKDGKEVPERTEWVSLVSWRGLAEIAEKYLHKGDKVYVEGRLTTRSYDDKDGVKRYVTEVVLDNMEMLSTKKDSGSAPVVPEPEKADTEDIPF